MEPKETTHTLKLPLQYSSSPRDKEPDDLQKLGQWQEERMARKLRGEYESAVLHLSEVVSATTEMTVRCHDRPSD